MSTELEDQKERKVVAMPIEMGNFVLLTILLIMTSILMCFVIKIFLILMTALEQRALQVQVPEINERRQLGSLQRVAYLSSSTVLTQGQIINRRAENRVRPRPQENDETEFTVFGAGKHVMKKTTQFDLLLQFV